MTTDKIYDDTRHIRADYCEYRMVKTRKVLQLIFEVPLERQEEVFKRLGYPLPDREIPVAIARLELSAKEELREQLIASEIADRNVVPLKDPARSERFRNLSSADQAKALAHMWAADPEFWSWCGAKDEDEAMEHIYAVCDVESCKEFSHRPATLERFNQLIAIPYQQKIGRLAEMRR